LRWVLPGQAAEGAVGARLDLDLSVEPSSAELAALQGFATDPMPWHDVRLLLDGPGFDSVEAAVSVLSGTTGGISVELGPQAASVLEALLTRSAVSPLQVSWIGRVMVQLPAVEVVASCSTSEVRTRLERARGGRSVSLTRAFIEANAHIEIRGDEGHGLADALRDWALDELMTRFTAGEDMMVKRSASEVVLWPIRLASTLDALLPEEQRRELVQVHALDPGELGSTPPVDVRALADFRGALERVEVELEPIGQGRPARALLTDEEPCRLSLGTRHFRHRRRLKYASQSPGAWSPWVSVENRSSLLIPVPRVEPLQIEVVAAGLDFERRWSAVRVALEHHGDRRMSHALELKADRRSDVWTSPLNGPRGRVTARLEFLARNGGSAERTIDSVNGDHIVVADPFAGHRRHLTLVPVGTGWSEVAAAMVDLRYRDGEQVTEETVRLGNLADFAEWEAPARPDGPRTVEWRSHVSYSDGRFESTEWDSTEDAVLTVRVDAPLRREVQVLPVFFDPVTTTRIEFQFRNGDFSRTEQITNRSACSIIAPPGPYRWSAAWVAIDGSSRQLPEQTSDDDTLVLPRSPDA